MTNIMESIITIDAMGTQKDITEKIVGGGADYILALKDNHETQQHDMELMAEEDGPLVEYEEVDK